MDLFDAISLICFTIPAVFGLAQGLAVLTVVGRARGLTRVVLRQAVVTARCSPLLYLALALQAVWVGLALVLYLGTQRLPLSALGQADYFSLRTGLALLLGVAVLAAYIWLSAYKLLRLVQALRQRLWTLRAADSMLAPRGGRLARLALQGAAFLVSAERRVRDHTHDLVERFLTSFVLASLAKVALLGSGVAYYHVVLPG